MIVLDLTENDQQRVTVKHRLFKKFFFRIFISRHMSQPKPQMKFICDQKFYV